MLNTMSNTSGVTTFKSQPIITSTAPANTDSSTNIATTAWSNAFWTYVKTQANTFSGTTTLGTTNTESITAPTTTSNMTIGTNLNGGSVTIGATSTTTINGTTAINIGALSTQTGNIAIGTNNAVLSGTNQIFIGANNKTTNISGNINMSGSVNINTSGTGNTTIGNILSTTNISGNINMSGAININTIGNATTMIGNGAVNINTTGTGNTIIGNVTGSAYTSIESNAISIGKYLTGAGYISIGSDAVTTTGYCIFGSAGMDASYIRAKNIFMNGESGNINMGNPGGTSSFYGNIKMGLDSPTFKNIISYKIDQPSSYANLYRYVSFAHTFTYAPAVLVSASFDNPGYLGYAQVRSITTTGFYYSLVLNSTSSFSVFFAGDPHILSYVAIGT